jgi:FdhD protein
MPRRRKLRGILAILRHGASARRARLERRGAAYHHRAMEEFAVKPDPDDPLLTRRVAGVDQEGRSIETAVVMERPLTLFLNGQEIVTMMTIGDHPGYLAVGYLLNQNMLREDDEITAIDHDPDLDTVVVRTVRQTDFEDKMKKKTLTSGCAQGTVFGDLMEAFETTRLSADAVLRTSWLYALTRKINTVPSLYLAAGAIHGCVLCREDRPLIYMEDVGRHNAVDKVAGYMRMHGIAASDKIFYTTGRLTSEMVIKTVRIGIPIRVSRSGFTAWGVDLARQAGLTLVGRARGRRFIALSGAERIVFDDDPRRVEEESPRLRRKASREDDAA